MSQIEIQKLKDRVAELEKKLAIRESAYLDLCAKVGELAFICYKHAQDAKNEGEEK